MTCVRRVYRAAKLGICSALLLAGSAQANGVATSQAGSPQMATPGAPPASAPTIAGARARLRADGTAALPEDAPARVRAVVAAANEIIGKPYKWGGGHGSLVDSGYDCSGAVSYGLVRARLLDAPLSSGQFAAAYAPGAGHWVSVFSNEIHVYTEVAGLRLDTSSVGDAGGLAGVRWRPVIGRRPGFAASHPAGL